MPEREEAEQSSEEVACPRARASGRGLWELLLQKGSGQGKGRVSGAGQIWVPVSFPLSLLLAVHLWLSYFIFLSPFPYM